MNIYKSGRQIAFKLIIILNFALGVFSLSYCNGDHTENEKSIVPSDSTNFRMQEELSSNKWQKIDSDNQAFIEDRKRFIDNANKTKLLIADPFSDPKVAIRYINNYHLDSAALDVLEKGAPTENVWIDIKALSNMMKLLNDSSGDGIRIYFSKYDKYDETSASVDVLRRDKGAYDNKYSVIIATTKPEGNNHITFYKKEKLGTTSICEGLYNYNELCPPNNNCVGIEIPE